MSKFTDTNGTDWVVAFDTEAIKRCRLNADCDPIDLQGDVFEKLMLDPVVLVDVLFCLCESQIEDRKLGRSDFARRIVGDTLDTAKDAVAGALLDFFPNHERRIWERAWPEWKALQKAAQDQALDTLAEEKSGV